MILDLLNKQTALFDELDPQRIYVENVRSFFRIPFKAAKFFCEMAVKDKVFIKKYGIYCPNEECGRLIKSYSSRDEVENHVNCETCEMADREKFNFDKEDFEIIEFYQLFKK
ncbi:hypothetical protein SAMN05428642_101825 [Flaviramulus basaltis]|uniref:Uncharacterized protein n=1 Tax=Flaviramulus basaltis TaxID=369401 RepID=A0A1K2ID79_9FLAO|nr:hypothetical protein [Flaviramulus basaltis]SFZ90248.1 hypothetical protein SAMN05428642_101825 [Flaviramulus basaltis]